MATERVVTLTNFDLVSILEGRTLQEKTLDGEYVLVRLATPDELLEQHREACAKFGEKPSMTREKAEELTRALPSL